MKTGLRLYVTMMLGVAAACANVAHSQGRGSGMAGGVPGGMPGGMSMRPDISEHGPPEWNDHASGRAATGLERADLVQDERLSKAQSDRASSISRDSPADYELDRNGALAIRGEVLVSGLDDARLARFERAGFRIVRRSKIPDLGISLAVVIHDGMSAARAAERLRRIDPGGSYELNNVYFESRGQAQQPFSSPSPAHEGAGRAATVGMIDSGVAAVIDKPGRVRVVRRSFGAGHVAAAHGTAVAALLAREPGSVTIYAADIFGSGPRGGTAELLARALGWMAGEHVPVINISMVGPPNGLIATATRMLIARGFTIVAPVGNDGPAARSLYPASYPGVVAVSAADATGRLLPEASRVKRIDFVGPGIASVPDLLGRSTLVRGTSFAAPIISRKLADLVALPDPFAARRAIDRLSKDAVRPKSRGNFFGYGLVGIDAVNAAEK